MRATHGKRNRRGAAFTLNGREAFTLIELLAVPGVARRRPMGSARAKRSMSAFTLIELLVVMGIVGVLLVMAVGAYQSIGRAAQVDTAVTQLKFTMQLTRQWAITNRQATWIVFPTMRPQGQNVIRYNGIEVASNVNFRAYGVYAEIDENNTEMLREWSHLPEGILFDWRPWHNTKNVLNPGGEHNIPNANPWDSDLRSQAALGFSPNGSLFEKQWTPEIYISEGFIAPGNTPTHQRLVYNHGPPNSGFTFNPNTHDFVLHAIQIYPFTGLPQITRYGEDNQ